MISTNSLHEKKIRKKRIINPTFLTQLYNILQNPNYQNIIEWEEKGESFIILDKEKLSNQVLPTVYRHNKLQSFLRQLNFYGFKKVCSENHLLSYIHPEFQKHQPNLSIQKKERKRLISADKASFQQIQSEMHQIKRMQIEMQNQISQCAFGFTEMTKNFQLLFNDLFEQRRNITKQGSIILITLNKIILGMLKEKQNVYQELIRILFPQSELEQPFQIESSWSCNFSEFSPVPFINFMISTCPSAPIQQTSELLNILERMAREDVE